jgi:hypothetical protein
MLTRDELYEMDEVRHDADAARWRKENPLARIAPS